MSETQHRVFLLTACFALLHALRGEWGRRVGNGNLSIDGGKLIG